MRCEKCNGYILGETCVNCGWSIEENDPLYFSNGVEGSLCRMDYDIPGCEWDGMIKRRKRVGGVLI